MKNAAKLQFKIEKIIGPVIIVAIAVLFRLLPHPANFTPIAAMALFGGAYLDKKYAFIVPLLAMFFSDLFLGFHASMPMVYTSFLITGIIGLFLKQHKTIANVFGASILSSVIFFVLTNFNFWYAGTLYPRTWSGMVEAYVNALPFFRNTLFGDLFYVSLFFGSYEFFFMMTKKKVFAKR